MSEKTIPEQARSLAKFIEENNYNEWPEDWEIAGLLENLAAEIESESKAADELQGECNNWHYQYQRMCEYAKRLGAERDESLKQRTKLISSLMQIASAVELELGKDFDTKSRIGLALSRAGKLLDLGGCDD